mmetsp:Transcript_119900/g.187270  ORF Transcript_119900/g.187270 Transcript_119900/m.187270 type:complete len:202 (-) Transcript_119900:79-684(-)
MFLQEAAHYIRPKNEGNSTIIFCPSCDVLIWVSPQEITNQTCVWHIRWTHQATDLVEVIYLWRQTSMHAHNLLVDKSTNRHAIEDVAELLPHLDVVAPLALIVEPVDPGDRCTFVVSSQLEKVFRVFRLVRKHQRDGFETLLTAIDVVTEEDIVALGWHSTILEEAQEIVVLAMHIAADFNGRFELKQRTLAQEDFAHGSA